MEPVTCPQCGGQLDLGRADAESRIECNHCGQRLKLWRKRDLLEAAARAAADALPAAPASPAVSLPAAVQPQPASKTEPLPGPRPPSGPSTRSRDKLLPTPIRAPVPDRAPELSVPQAADGSRKEPHGTEPHGTEPHSTKSAGPVVTLELRATKTSDEVLREAARRKLLRQRLAAVGLTLLSAASVVAIYFLANPPQRIRSTNQAAQDEVVEAGSRVDAPKATAEVLEKTAPDPAQTAVVQTAEKPAGEPAELVAAPIAWGELRTFSRRELEKLWAEIHPYLFRLVVHKPNGDRVISGVLIDSRGWVATSLSAVEGARSLEVYPAPADPLSEFAADNLRDEVRGILAVDRPRDLVLLQINRRLVNVVTALKSTEKLLVPGRPLIQAASVGPERWGWLTETRMVRTDPATFPAEVKQLIERRGLDLAPYWPAHRLAISQGAGAALFTPEGELAGVNTGLSTAEAHFFAEAPALQSLLKNAREPAAPLSNLSSLEGNAQKTTVGNPPAEDPAAGGSPFPPGHEAEPVASQLAEAARACAAFGWQPEPAAEMQAALAAGLLAWRDARELVRSRKLFPEDARKLSGQLAHWTSQLKAALLTLDRNQMTEFNRRAWDSLEGAAAEPRALFVRVVMQPGTSPRFAGNDTATLEVIGLPQQVVATVSDDIAPLLPESEWLVVVRLDAKQETAVNPAPGQAISPRRGSELREIAEVKSVGLRLEGPPPDDDKDDQ